MRQRVERAEPWVLAVLAAVALGVALVDPRLLLALLEWARPTTAQPATLVVVIGLMALLITFALPGSVLFWLIAPFQPLAIAVAVLLAGSVLGAVGAYYTARTLGGDGPHGARKRALVGFVAARSDAATLCALRILPGFPHSVVNYASGVLRLPIGRFVATTIVGLAIKWTVYSSVVHSGMDAASGGDAIRAIDLAPLIILALLLLGGAWLHRRVKWRH